jgi:uncharacterized membrane protein YraQ (UPF0718 family)
VLVDGALVIAPMFVLGAVLFVCATTELVIAVAMTNVSAIRGSLSSMLLLS